MFYYLLINLVGMHSTIYRHSNASADG